MSRTPSSPAPAPRMPASRQAIAGAGSTLLSALFLAACGGGNVNSPPPPPPPPPPAPNEVPATAAASIASWEQYAASLAPSETADPLQLDLITTVPTSETADPVTLP